MSLQQPRRECSTLHRLLLITTRDKLSTHRRTWTMFTVSFTSCKRVSNEWFHGHVTALLTVAEHRTVERNMTSDHSHRQRRLLKNTYTTNSDSTPMHTGTTSRLAHSFRDGQSHDLTLKTMFKLIIRYITVNPQICCNLATDFS